MTKNLTPFLIFIAFIIKISSCNELKQETEMRNLTQYVDPYIGTGDHGHVFLGANVPFGMVQLYPLRQRSRRGAIESNGICHCQLVVGTSGKGTGRKGRLPVFHESQQGS